jgi:hypothetical protein
MDITLIYLGVRSLMLKISVCWVITCTIVRKLLINMEYVGK